MKLILMTLPTFFVEEHKILTALFDEGLELLHLRKPHTEPVYSERLLSLIPDEYHKRIVVHDHFYLKEEYGLYGIHVGHLATSEPRAYRGRVSCTCHTAAEVQAYRKQFNYLFFSPVFASSGEAQATGQAAEQLSLALNGKLIDKKVMAFGNVTLERLSSVRNMGFGGAVILGDLWNRFDMHADTDFKNLIVYFRHLQKAAN